MLYNMNLQNVGYPNNNIFSKTSQEHYIYMCPNFFAVTHTINV
jgi:hypothetical protein